MKWRYGEEDTSYLHHGSGHTCQNLLNASSVAVYAIAAFSDDHINNLLELDGVERFVMYIATVGKK